MKNRLLSVTENYQNEDLQPVFNIGQSDTLDRLEGKRSIRPDETRAGTSPMSVHKIENESDYDELIQRCVNVEQRIRCSIKTDAIIERKFVCGREHGEKVFVALVNACPIEKFVLRFTLYRNKDNDLMRRAISIDSRESGSLKNDIQTIMLFKMNGHMVLYIQSFSGKQKCFRVGIDCEEVMISYEYVADSFAGIELRNTYVGYNVGESWRDKRMNQEIDKLVPNASCLEGLTETLESVYNRGMGV